MKIVTVTEVEDRLKDIEFLSNTDDEAAHSAEDKLYRDVLYTIANAKDQTHTAELAEKALSARLIDFRRWCA